MPSFWRKHTFALCYGLLLSAACGLILLDTFVIPRAERAAVDQPLAATALPAVQAAAPAEALSTASAETLAAASGAEAVELPASPEQPAAPAATPQITAASYRDGQIQVEIQTLRQDGTTYYVADVQLSDPSYLRTALAQNTYGRNLKETTSEMAQSAQAILAVNGDYYGFRSGGYVVRNGTLYRETPSGADLLLVDRQGDFSAMAESALSPVELDSGKWWQVFSFGPTLVADGAVTVSPNAEVGQAKTSNPRTAVGQIGPLHYVFVVSDGRTSESAGFTLYELAGVMQALGCQTAYNLDGGGSSTMVFLGQVVNNPTTNGRSIAEREVSDIVYIGL